MKNERKTGGREKKSVRYPTKTTINLAKREPHSRSIVTLVVGIAVIAVLAAAVTKFGVLDQLARLREAESTYLATHSQYLEIQQEIEEYPTVEQEYRTYSRKWMQDDSSDSSDSSNLFVSVDRIDVLALMEDHLMPYGEVKSVSVQDTTMEVTMTGMDLEQISEMFIQLQKQPIVSGAELNIASTVSQSEDASKLDFSVTITLTPAEEAES